MDEVKEMKMAFSRVDRNVTTIAGNVSYMASLVVVSLLLLFFLFFNFKDAEGTNWQVSAGGKKSISGYIQALKRTLRILVSIQGNVFFNHHLTFCRWRHPWTRDSNQQ